MGLLDFLFEIAKKKSVKKSLNAKELQQKLIWLNNVKKKKNVRLALKKNKQCEQE